MKKLALLGTLGLAVMGLSVSAYAGGSARVTTTQDTQVITTQDQGTVTATTTSQQSRRSSRNANNNNGNDNNQNRTTDRRFLQQAITANVMEIELARVAASNSTDSAVQAFANDMIAEHTAALEQLQTLADTLSITVSTNFTRSQARTAQAFSRLSGTRFDVNYISRQIRDHQSNIRLYTAAATSARSEDVRAYARTQLPVLTDHLVSALEIREALITSGALSVNSNNRAVVSARTTTRATTQ